MIEQISFPNGAKSDACVKSKTLVGTGDRASVTFAALCFDDSGRLAHLVDSRYEMGFGDYKAFDGKQIARRLTDNPEPGTAIVGLVTQLEDESRAKTPPDLFQPLPQDEERFRTVAGSAEQLEGLTASAPPIVWPAVDHGSGRGHIAMYVSVDAEGQVREAWPLSADDAGLEDPAREQVRAWKLAPARDDSGHTVQIDGPMSFLFVTTVGPPPLHLSDSEVRALATKMDAPVWQKGSGQQGEVVEFEITVNEQGKLTGLRSIRGQVPAFMSVNDALHKWIFRPLVRDGKPQSFHGTLLFAIR